MTRIKIIWIGVLLFGRAEASAAENPLQVTNPMLFDSFMGKLEQSTEKLDQLRNRVQFEATSVERVIQYEAGTKQVVKTTSNTQSAKFKQGKGGYVFERTPVGEVQNSGVTGLPFASDFSSIIGANSKYMFVLKSDAKSKGYVLQTLTMLDTDEAKAKDNKRISHMRVIDPLAHFYHSDKKKIENLKDIKLSPIRSISESGTACTLISDQKMGQNTFYRTTTTFDIAANYACSSRRAIRFPSCPNDIEVISQYEFANIQGEFLLSRSITSGELLGKDSARIFPHVVVMETEQNFKSRLVDDLPESEFTLSAYGFPEPAGVAWEKPTPRYVWWMIAVGCFAILAVLTRWMARRVSRKYATN